MNIKRITCMQHYEILWEKVDPASLPRMEYRDHIRSVQQRMLAEALSLYKKSKGEKSAGQILPALAYGTYGKPYIPSLPDFHYNFSDSGDYILLAWSNGEIGVDLQKIVSTRYDVERIARRFYRPEEYRYLCSIEDMSLRRLMFFRLWSIKEAYLKYIGIGLSGGMRRYRIVPEQTITEEKTKGRIIPNDPSLPCVHYEEISTPESGYCAAVVNA